MKLKLQEIEIPKENPFQNDKLNRLNTAESLTILIENIKIPFVLGIHSECGTGKTTFIKMWRQYLINKKVPSVYYNAWENDFNDSALITLLGEIEKGINELSTTSSRKRKITAKFEVAKNIGAGLVKKGIPVAVKVLTSGAVDLEKGLEDAVSDVLSDYSKQLIDEYEKSKKSISSFRNKLNDFVKEVSKGNTIFKNKPFVIFIDELDRCRPDFALQILEKSKHFFNITGIIFIYSYEKEHLSNSLRTIYGSALDVDGYLRRFFDLTYKLPSLDETTLCEYLFEKYGINSFFSTRVYNGNIDRDSLLNTIKSLFKIFGFSVRTQEQIFTQLTLSLLTTSKSSKLFPIPLVTLICLKNQNPKLYYDYTTFKSSSEDVIDYLKSFPNSKTIFDKNIGAIIEGYIIALSPIGDNYSNYTYPLLDKYKTLADQSSNYSIARDKYNRILRMTQSEEYNDPKELLVYLAKKIDFAIKLEEENLSLIE